MKQLKFDHARAQLIMSGKQTNTIRIADDKDIQEGDILQIVDKVVSDQPSSWLILGDADVIAVTQKPISDLKAADYQGQEVYENPKDMLISYRRYYGSQISEATPVKIITFQFRAYQQPALFFQAAERTDEEQGKRLPTVVKMYADGGSRGNPGPSALGFVICDVDGSVLREGSKYLGITTNNQAEYHALKMGLEICKAEDVREVDVFMDSLLVINQMKGIFKVKNRDLWPIYEAIKGVASTFRRISFTHVPRELNKLADAEVNKALDAIKG